MPGREGSRCLTRQEQVASYSRALVVTAATATMLKAAVLLHRMSLNRSRVFPGVCTKAHEGVFQGAPRGGAHTSPPVVPNVVRVIARLRLLLQVLDAGPLPGPRSPILPSAAVSALLLLACWDRSAFYHTQEQHHC